MIEATRDGVPGDLRLGEGEFPARLDRVNFGAFLLAVLWAPWHRLWGWFAVFVALEILESVVGLTGLTFFPGALAQLVAMTTFRIVYWTVTVAFAMRANRLVWARSGKVVADGDAASNRPRPGSVSTYIAHQRLWTVAGLIGLILAPLSLLIGSVRGIPDAVFDVAVTVGVQAVLLVGLFAYDKMRSAGRGPSS